MRKILLLSALLLAMGSSIIVATDAALPQHEDQPKSCDNVFNNPHKCECERAQKECDPDNQYASQKCKTYCRPEACKCANKCNTPT